MNDSQSRLSAHLCTGVGVLSVISGALLLAAPATMARLYALPRRAGLMRGIGVRDLAIGLGLFDPRLRRGACVGRALADSLDFLLIAHEASRVGAHRPVRLAVALASAVTGALLSRSSGAARA